MPNEPTNAAIFNKAVTMSNDVRGDAQVSDVNGAELAVPEPPGTLDTVIRFNDRAETLSVGSFSLQKTGLVVRGVPSFEEWERFGTLLNCMEGAVQLWIGDWLNYGEKTYGEKYAQAMDMTGLDYGTLANYASVARRIDPSSRDERVRYKVHEAVAGLCPVDQRRWLARAAEEQMTVAQVRSGLRLEKRAAHYTSGVVPIGKFRVVYADPPWPCDDNGVIVDSAASGVNGRRNHTMTIEALAAMPVIDRLEDNARVVCVGALSDVGDMLAGDPGMGLHLQDLARVGQSRPRVRPVCVRPPRNAVVGYARELHA